MRSDGGTQVIMGSLHGGRLLRVLSGAESGRREDVSRFFVRKKEPIAQRPRFAVVQDRSLDGLWGYSRASRTYWKSFVLWNNNTKLQRKAGVNQLLSK